ncbi:hypothetical protein CASFOL_015764 [Castilleja foliolosa]|uniref:Uncharacterized protein n=1 Tax=Castilleja foliolosa TaxID=1961234 RepID=A0ABD3DIP6_9LAMI
MKGESFTFFYAGLAMFLFVTEHVQKPYFKFSPRRWNFIIGLKGYITSAFFIMGFKVFSPIIAVYVTWNESLYWPLLPIIFEYIGYIYQLTRAANFIEKSIYGMRDASVTPAVLDRTGALISMIVTFRILGIVCLWSLLTFLLRLFPSRPVAENY